MPVGAFFEDPRMAPEDVAPFVGMVYRRLGLAAVPPKVELVGNRRFARGGPFLLTLPPWALCKHIVLHELTHALLPSYCTWHGPEYVRTYVDLVYRFMHVQSGPLRKSLREAKIKVARSDITWELIFDERKRGY